MDQKSCFQDQIVYLFDKRLFVQTSPKAFILLNLTIVNLV